MYYEDGAVRVLEDVLGHGTVEQAASKAAATSGENDQIRPLLFGGPAESLAWVTSFDARSPWDVEVEVSERFIEFGSRFGLGARCGGEDVVRLDFIAYFEPTCR
jgi:hypothetical protein